MNHLNSELQSPLHLACTGGDLTTVKLLVERGAELEAATMALHRPLHLGMLYSFTDREEVQE